MRTNITILICAAAIFCAPAFPVRAAELSAGTARVNITPSSPIPMSGYGSRKAPFEAVHDSLYARVVVLGDGVRRAAIVNADIIGLSHDAWMEISGRIGDETGIGREYILLAPTHNHGGPVVRVYNRKPEAGVVAYNEELKTALVDAVVNASRGLRPVTVSYGRGECLMNINRRARHPNGDIALGRNPYGPCDHEVGAALLSYGDGSPAAFMINWSCHGTVMGPENLHITGDWPGAAARHAESLIGGNVVVPVLIGASGDINPLYGPHMDFVSSFRFYSFAVDAIGIDLSERAVQAVESGDAVAAGTLKAVQRVITLPKKNDTSNLQQPDVEGDEDLKVRLTVLRVGEMVFVGISGEVFNEIGVSIKRRSPYPATFVVTHCNGSSGYLVTDKAYQEGGYEVRSTRVRSGAEKLIIGAVLEMIAETAD